LRFRFAALLGFLGQHPHELIWGLAWERALEPVEELRGRIDLVIVLAVGEDSQFVQVCVEPRPRLGDVDKTVIDQRRLRVQVHDPTPVSSV